MPLVLGLDVGTTTITALALDAGNGQIVARETAANHAEITTPDAKARGRSDWDAARMAAAALGVLRRCSASLSSRSRDVAGIGLTGQQHGVVLVDDRLAPVTPFVNWQDRRAEEIDPKSAQSLLERVRSLAGEESRERTGCTLSTGYMGVTLRWFHENAMLPAGVTACFIVDYLGLVLTGKKPVTDATSAASSGLFDISCGDWDRPLIERLGLPATIFAAIHPAGEPHGQLAASAADATGLPAGLPVCVGLGDNQASFYGSVADLDDAILVNVGTGGQVAAYSKRFLYSADLETRPFPGGYLLVSAGLCGGRTYALLERFFRNVCDLTGNNLPTSSLYEAMNGLAGNVSRGADGLRCEPLFSGTRRNSELRGVFSGISAENFTPAHMARALLEGMATIFHCGRRDIETVLGKPRVRLVGAGNGMRENPVLARIVSDEFGMPLDMAIHREEAAFGAALVASVGLGILPGREAAAKLIRYQDYGGNSDSGRSSTR